MANNPAGRLLAILRRAQEFGDPQNSSSLKGWASVLECEPTDACEIFRRFSLVLRCVEDAKAEAVSLFGEDASMYLGWVNLLYSLWDNWNFKAPFSQFTAPLPNVINPIEVCDHQLSRHRRELTIDQTQLEQWLTTVREMIAGLIRQWDKRLRLRRPLKRQTKPQLTEISWRSADQSSPF